MEVLCITATKNRHKHLEKLVRCFLEQDYEGPHTLLIFNNAKEPQEIDDNSPPNKRILLVNNYTHSVLTRPYENLGEIYNDILRFVGKLELKPDIVNHMDDDDFFLPSHIKEGVEGYKRGGKLAYKPQKSYYKHGRGLSLENNALEPSVFVSWDIIKDNGYWDRNVDLHHKWMSALERNKLLYVDKEGKPTFVYDWGGEIPVYKTSGNPSNPNNFKNYEKFSQDIGDQIVTPITPKEYYDYINKLHI